MDGVPVSVAVKDGCEERDGAALSLRAGLTVRLVVGLVERLLETEREEVAMGEELVVAAPLGEAQLEAVEVPVAWGEFERLPVCGALAERDKFVEGVAHGVGLRDDVFVPTSEVLIVADGGAENDERHVSVGNEVGLGAREDDAVTDNEMV